MGDEITRRRFLAGTAAAALALRRAPAGAAATAPLLSRSERRTLRAAMDVIIPAEDHMPTASSTGAVDYVEAITAEDAELRRMLLNALRALGTPFARSSGERQVAALTQLEGADPAAFGVLRDAVYEAYYTNATIQRLIGYRFRSGPRPTATLDAFDERQLVRVRQMSRSYREVE